MLAVITVVFALVVCTFLFTRFSLFLTSRIAVAVSLTITAIILAIAFYGWRSQGEIVGDPIYDPTGEYFVEKFALKIGMNPFSVVMPGNGSDNVDGFIRLRSKEGKLLDEAFVTFLYGTDAEWSDGVYYIYGGSNAKLKP